MDDQGIEVVVMGRGIGFQKKSGECIDKDKIDKIFYMENDDERNKFQKLIANLPIEHIQISNEIISYAKKMLPGEVNQNIYITLTDHINFAIERMNEGMLFQNAIANEVKIFYPREYTIGKYGVQVIQERLGVQLPEDEIASIALHFVNAEYNTKMSEIWGITQLFQGIVTIVEKELKVVGDEDNLYWSQFITNLKFLGRSLFFENNRKEDLDERLNEFVKTTYVDEYRCAMLVEVFARKEFSFKLTEADKVNLALEMRRVRSYCKK